jgi:hypothetical protein
MDPERRTGGGRPYLEGDGGTSPGGRAAVHEGKRSRGSSGTKGNEGEVPLGGGIAKLPGGRVGRVLREPPGREQEVAPTEPRGSQGEVYLSPGDCVGEELQIGSAPGDVADVGGKGRREGHGTGGTAYGRYLRRRVRGRDGGELPRGPSRTPWRMSSRGDQGATGGGTGGRGPAGQGEQGPRCPAAVPGEGEVHALPLPGDGRYTGSPYRGRRRRASRTGVPGARGM